jgi:hypothetical protein
MRQCPQCGQPVAVRGGPGRPATYCGVPCRRRAEQRASAARLAQRHRQWLADIEAGRVETPWWMQPEAADVLAELG